jgi:hypothetical protein
MVSAVDIAGHAAVSDGAPGRNASLGAAHGMAGPRRARPSFPGRWHWHSVAINQDWGWRGLGFMLAGS